MKTILVVDDTPDNLSLLRGVLHEQYRVKIANSGEKALKIAHMGALPDLVLLDIMMPEMDGFEVCRHLQEDARTRDIPIIFLTAKTEIKDEQQGFELGAVDYIHKPISVPILLARVETHLKLKASQDQLKNQNAILEEKVQLRVRQLAQLQDVTMAAMGTLAEFRDPETGNHIRRTQHYVKLLAQSLQHDPLFADYLTPSIIELLYKSAPLHDIGKVGVPDHILLKPGRLSDDEFVEMKKHAKYGHDAIISAEAFLDEPESFLQMAREIAYAHHERWDGTGYPVGLKGEAIPLPARLMAVADVYDALISKRVYKPPFPHEKAVKIILEGSGSHFDPRIVQEFEEISDQFLKISQQFLDQ
ncbi:response regulator [Magnetococcales bacterium HHB-1]